MESVDEDPIYIQVFRFEVRALNSKVKHCLIINTAICTKESEETHPPAYI